MHGKMLGLEPEIEAEYQRVLNNLDNAAPVGPHCLSIHEVLRAHFLIANHFYLEGKGLGGIGPRDMGLLQSAVHRQTVSFGGASKWVDRFDVCATLLFGLIKNHPFHDANKRTAFLGALFQLRRFGRCPSVNEREFENFTVEVAENGLARYARYKELVKNGDADPEVKLISHYLRKHTRQIDTQHYAVTYRELQTILNGYGFALANPRGNHID